MSIYKKAEPKGPSADSLLLKEAIQSIPTTDNTNLEEKLQVLCEEVRKAGEQRDMHYKASQEAYEQSLDRVVASLDSIANIKLEAPQEQPEPIDVKALLEGMAKLMPKPTPPPKMDVEGLVEKVFELTNKETKTPSYDFKVERNHSGVLVGIKATPIE